MLVRSFHSPWRRTNMKLIFSLPLLTFAILLVLVESTAAEEPAKIEPLDNIDRILVKFNEEMRFGIACPELRDPRNAEKPKLLTRDERGITNNTCFRIEGYEFLFGVEIPGSR